MLEKFKEKISLIFSVLQSLTFIVLHTCMVLFMVKVEYTSVFGRCVWSGNMKSYWIPLSSYSKEFYTTILILRLFYECIVEIALKWGRFIKEEGSLSLRLMQFPVYFQCTFNYFCKKCCPPTHYDLDYVLSHVLASIKEYFELPSK